MENIVAYRSNRSYVFQDLIWNPDHFPWRQEDRRRCEKGPSSQQTPLSALLSGPTVGGFWDPGDNAPRSISQHWFNTVCPINERRIISTKEVKTAVYWDKGSVLFDAWQKVLSEAPERCIEVQGSPEDPFPQPFDTWLWAGEWVLSMWDRIKDSPVSRLLGPSPIIQAAVARNEYLFRPRGPRPPGAVSTNPYDGMVAAHVRRGDFEGHCRHLATWNSTFYSWNQLSFLSDRFVHPPNYEWGTQSEEGVRHYLKHCYPDMDAIVEKIRKSKADYVRAGKPNDYRHLNVIFILSDDQSEWLEDLKKSLRNDGWSTVVSTLDLVVDAEQREVGVAIDMELARKAALFIGNGVRSSLTDCDAIADTNYQWSSLTSNIVYRRLVDGRENMSIRFF